MLAGPGGATLDGGVAALVGADAHHFVERNDEDLAVTDLAGLSRAHDGVDRLADGFVGDGDFNFHLRKEVHRVFAAAVDLRVALLAAETLDLGDSHTLDPDFGESGFHFLELEGLDDGDDE